MSEDEHYRSGDFFFLRGAAFSYRVLQEIDAIDDSAMRENALCGLFGNPKFYEALWLAAPDVADSAQISREPAVASTLYRYLVRGATRCNPFGLFTWLAVGRVENSTRLISDTDNQKVVRLDTGLVERVWTATAIECVRITSPLYRVNGVFRYIELVRDGRANPRYVLSELAFTPLLERIADLAAKGCELSLIRKVVAEDAQVSEDEATDYLTQLLGNGFLVSATDPPLTGDLRFEHLAQEIETVDGEAGDRLSRALRVARDVEDSQSSVPDAANEVLDILAVDEHPPNEALQIDLVRDDVFAISHALEEEIRAGAIALLLMRADPAADPLRTFKRDFAERWGDAAVPLAVAVDVDYGIALDAEDREQYPPLLSGYHEQPLTKVSMTIEALDAEFLQRAIEVTAAGGTEVEVTAKDVEQRVGRRVLPSSFSALCSIASATDQFGQSDPIVVLNAVSGGSGARHLGRFCGVVPGLTDLVRNFYDAADAHYFPDIVADILFTPGGRVGNVIRREKLRKHEIPVLCRSSSESANVVRIEDLLLYLVGDDLVLWDERRQRRVRPRLPVAHNFSRAGNLAIYRLLCYLDEKDSAPGGPWQWCANGGVPFLPRVRFRNSILARAQWLLPTQLRKQLLHGDRGNRLEAVRDWRQRVRCPNQVMVGSLDERITVDLDSQPGIDLLARLIRQENVAVVQEAFPGHHDGAVCSHGERVAHELVIPFRRISPESFARTRVGSPIRTCTRSAADEWTYVKCYVSKAIANAIVVDAGRFFMRAVARGSVDRWFFVRYADPEWHLRIRFRARKQSRGRILESLRRRLESSVGSGAIWRWQLERYVPEIFRYGGVEALHAAEGIFWRDAQAAATLLSLRKDSEDWLICLLSIDALLGDFGYVADERLAFVRSRRDAYVAETGNRSEVVAHGSQLCRRYRPIVMNALSSSSSVVHSILRKRSQHFGPFVTDIQDLATAGRLTVPVVEMVASFAHMTANRILSSQQRLQELFILDLLMKAYESKAALGGRKT